MTVEKIAQTLSRKLRLLFLVPVLLPVLMTADHGASATASAAPAPVAAVPAVTRTAVENPAIASPAVASPAAAFQGAEGLSPQVLAAALDAVACAKARGVQGKNDVLTVIDYSLPSTTPRLWVLDLAHGKVLYHELVAHGSGSGDNYATRFSNTNDSKQTSLGLFLTAGTYEGGNGYSLKLRGLDPGLNDRAEARHIVMHGAWYVSEEHAREQGRLGRSWGCPALSLAVAHQVIDTVKGGTFIYSYSGDQTLQAAAKTCPATPGSGTTVAATFHTAR